MNRAKEKQAIEYLKLFEPPDEPYWVGYSGGKDSDAIRILCSLANVRHELQHNHTTLDAPETVYYVRSIPNIHINYPERSIWQLILDEAFVPTRFMRFCCRVLKERGGKGRLKVLGVRKAESVKRANNADLIKVVGKPKGTEKIANELELEYSKPYANSLIMNVDDANSRQFVERCFRTRSTMINPIVDWTDEDVWEFLSYYGCKANPLYEEGYTRVGCIGCPLSSRKLKEAAFERYPKYKRNFLRLFDKVIKKRQDLGKPLKQKTSEEFFDWWLDQ